MEDLREYDSVLKIEFVTKYYILSLTRSELEPEEKKKKKKEKEKEGSRRKRSRSRSIEKKRRSRSHSGERPPVQQVHPPAAIDHEFEEMKWAMNMTLIGDGHWKTFTSVEDIKNIVQRMEKKVHFKVSHYIPQEIVFHFC